MAAEPILHMQKALSQMNLQLHDVLSDITGTSGQAILDAILSGQCDTVELASLCHSGNVWVTNNWQDIDSCSFTPQESLSTRCGGQGVVVFYRMAKPVKGAADRPAARTLSVGGFNLRDLRREESPPRHRDSFPRAGGQRRNWNILLE
jgi:hypothetical protein